VHAVVGIEYKAKLIYMFGDAPLDGCGCHYCHTEWRNVMDDLDPDGWMTRFRAFMILCDTCGAKRCPRATYHGHECTHSNEPGQPLSVYGDFRLPNQRESSESENVPSEHH
jgi:hypothetical protein